MKNLKAKVLAISGIASPLLALAEDYDYGTASDVGAVAGLAIFGGLFIVWIIVMLVGLAFFIFWIFMLIDCIKREFEQRNTWLIILIVSFFIGLSWLAAILYYFMIKRKNLGTKPSTTPTPPASPAQPK